MYCFFILIILLTFYLKEVTPRSLNQSAKAFRREEPQVKQSIFNTVKDRYTTHKFESLLQCVDAKLNPLSDVCSLSSDSEGSLTRKVSFGHETPSSFKVGQDMKSQ